MEHKFSKRLLQVQASPTLALNAKANALKKQGKPILSFVVGEPDYDTPRVIVDALIDSVQKGRTRYGAAGGGAELRQAICAKLRRENHLAFSPEQVVVGIGAKEILFHLCLSLLNEGDEVVFLAPYWVSYGDQVVAAGGKPVVVPPPESGLDVTQQIAQLESYCTSRTKILILNSPNNPAGYCFDEAALRQIGEIAKRHDWWIISDEIYEYLSFEVPHLSLLNLFPELASRFILVNGFSKGFAMTGWRVGYAAAPLDVAQILRNMQSQSSTCLPGFIEDAACVAIEHGIGLMEKEIASLHRRRDLAYGLLQQIPGIQMEKPQGAFYIFIDMRSWLKMQSRKETSMELCARLLETFHLALVPGEAFGAPGFIRMSYAVSEADIVAGLERLKNALC